MSSFSSVQTGLLLLSAAAIAVADVFLRKTQDLGSISKALMSPWVISAVALYLIQILIFTYLFISGARLFHLGIVQVVLYAILVLVASFVFFNESVTILELIGIIFALVGVFLINL